MAGLALLAASLGAIAGEPVFTRVDLPAPIADEPLDAEWHLPPGTDIPAALVVLQHGFSRRCANLRSLAAGWADAGFATVCLNADVARGHPALARAWAERLVHLGEAALRLPDGRALPRLLIVAGHSAGAHVAAIAGQRIAEIDPARLAGALLLDPVPADATFDGALSAISDDGRRPVRALLAEPHACNAHGRALAALQAVRQRARAAGRSGFVGLRIVGGTHADAEGPDTDFLAGRVCGRVREDATARLRAASLRWIAGMAAQARDPAPGDGASLQADAETDPGLVPID